MATWTQYALRPESRRVYTLTVTLGRVVGPAEIEEQTVSLATSELPAALGERWHRPALMGEPEILLSVGDLQQTGEAQQPSCALDIANDGWADGLRPPAWDWIGRPAVVSMGFEGLPLAQFRALFSGLVSRRAESKGRISLEISDPAALMWTVLSTPGDYAGDLPSVLAALLADAGVDNINASAWAAWAAGNNWPVWIRVGDNESIGSVVDRLLTGLCCAYYTDPDDGELRVFTLAAPADGETPTLTMPDWQIGDSAETADLTPRLNKLTVKWLSTTGDDPVYSSVEIESGDFKLLNPYAEDREIETCLTTEAAAEAIRDRRWALFSRPRRTARPAVGPVAALLGPGNLVRFESAMSHIAGDWRVVGGGVGSLECFQ